jgi:hypothetical protein
MNRFKLLKQQEEYQHDFLKEIGNKLLSLNDRKEDFKKKIEELGSRQKSLVKL